MMTVRNRVNMRTVYFILSLLLISCSKDDASEVPGKFELQSISIGEKQDQSLRYRKCRIVYKNIATMPQERKTL